MVQQSEQSASTLATKMEELAQKLISSANTIRTKPTQTTTQDYSGIIESADSLLGDLKEPIDRIMDMMVTLGKFCSMRLFIKWGLFDKIPSKGAISYEELASGIGADTGLISRLGASLVSTGVLREVESGKVSHTPQSVELTSENTMEALICLGFDSQLRSLAKLPEYFDTFGLHEPIGKYNTPIAFSQGDASITVWEHVNRSPEKMNTFMKSMVAMSSKTVTIGTYDFSWITSKASESPDRPLIVDVGGGKGHALQKIADATPGLPMERCVVEDLAPVLDEAKAQASGSLKQAQFVALDFHSEQPVKGAVVYYIRRCLHDYGDDDCVDILQQISNAMVADSRILIVENVMGDPPSPISIGNDILMMMLGGKERTLEGFKKIMGRAGLVVEKLWRVERTDYAIIEGRKA